MAKELSKIGFACVLVSLTGCSLYGTVEAPVYDNVSAQSSGGQSEPAIISSNTSEVTTASIEKPGTQAIEINSSATNPYQEVTHVTPIDAYGDISEQSSSLVDLNQNPTTDAGEMDTTGVMSASTLDDPRIQEATDILGFDTADSAQSVESSQANIDQTIATANAVLAQTDANLNATANTASTQVDLSKNTVVSNVQAQTSSATQSLLEEARAAVGAGNYDAAASALERAQRIEPQNPKILYDIAQIRYAQGDYIQAESFASRAASLSANSDLSKKIWTLLGNSRQALGQTSAAEAAMQKAASF